MDGIPGELPVGDLGGADRLRERERGGPVRLSGISALCSADEDAGQRLFAGFGTGLGDVLGGFRAAF